MDYVPGGTAYEGFGEAYASGLAMLLSAGRKAPSVTDPTSKASNFGLGDRPSLELLAYVFTVDDPTKCLATTVNFPVNLPYCFGLLAWTLDGRKDVESLAYYRPGAQEFSDDGYTLSGAFGNRLFGNAQSENQIAAILQLLSLHPGSRRAYATILDATDNFRKTREYPCAVGVQLFVRDGELHLIANMRAQQALSVLPYDAFLFMNLQAIAADSLGVRVGRYIHNAGTFHIYESEREVAARVVEENCRSATLPPLDPGTGDGVVRELIKVEAELRTAARENTGRAIVEIAGRDYPSAYLRTATRVLAAHAAYKSGIELPSNCLQGLPRDVIELLPDELRR